MTYHSLFMAAPPDRTKLAASLPSLRAARAVAGMGSIRHREWRDARFGTLGPDSYSDELTGAAPFVARAAEPCPCSLIRATSESGKLLLSARRFGRGSGESDGLVGDAAKDREFER